MSSRFYFASPTTSDTENSDYDDESLPFPKPLARSAFHTVEFDPATFLASLTARFQTLEDLQSELRQLSTSIQTELVDLVNDNYEEFLSLGGSLSGGEERIEEVRVGLMGVEREMAGLRVKVEEERGKVVEAMEAKRKVVREGWMGRGLLDLDRRVGVLEGALGMPQERRELEQKKRSVPDGDEWGQEWKGDVDVLVESEGEDEEVEDGQVSRRLKRRVEQWLCIKYSVGKYDEKHPFTVAEQPRLKKVKETLLLDIDAGIRARADVKGKQRLLEIRREVED